jgi:hypothetical protein
LVLGYKDSDVAIVPVTATENGQPIPICALKGAARDSFSVFGQFGGDANVSATAAVELKSFFSTGIAAGNLAEAYNRSGQGRADADALRAIARKSVIDKAHAQSTAARIADVKIVKAARAASAAGVPMSVGEMDMARAEALIEAGLKPDDCTRPRQPNPGGTG